MQNKKWLSLLLSLVVAVGLWVYVVTIENPVTDRDFKNIPVIFVGEDTLREDYNLLITDNNVPTGVSLSFAGKLAVLNRLSDSKDALAVKIDVSGLRKAQEYPFTFNINDITLPASVSVHEVNLKMRNPGQITITLEKLAKRSIPVKVVTMVDVAEGYTPDRLTQNYNEITIIGPEAAVKQVDYAQVVLKREKADETIVANLGYQLLDDKGNAIDNQNITSDVTEIEVTLPILMYKDVPLDIPVIEGGGATSADIVVDILPKTVQLSGDPKVLETIEKISLPALDLSSLMTNNEVMTRVITVPEGCTNLSGEQTASISVQIKNKAIRQMHISSNHFSCTGLPSTMKAVPRTNVLAVTVRANEEDINLIHEDNVRIVMDASNINLSEKTEGVVLPVKVYVDGFDGAGAVSEAEQTVVVDFVSATQQ